jgi:hypothetical protein
VEFIRFALLIVVTIGLFSVAARAFDDDAARPGARGPGNGVTTPGSATPGVTRSPDGSPSESSGSSDGATPPGDGSSEGATGGGSSGDGASGADGTSTGGAGSGGTGSGAIAAPELPRTGPDTALRLTGIALVLIAGGGLSLAGARRTA